MLGIILINYKNENELVKYIYKELAKTSVVNKIVVVKNSYEKGNHKELRLRLEQIEARVFNQDLFLITKKDNLGFARANNFGAQFLVNKFEIRYFLFSNTDIELHDADVIESLIQKINVLPKEIAVIGPRVIGLDGKNQSPHPKISFARYAAWKLLPFLRGLKKSQSRDNNKFNETEERPCYWVSGCFMLIRSKDFISAEYFDENTFLYAEEMILAERLKKINRSMYFFPSKKIIHFEGGSTLKKYNRPEVNKLAEKSKVYYYNTYLGIPKVIISLLHRI